MQKLENFIYSVKYLPTILYFGSVALLAYDIYCDLIKDTEFLNGYTETPLIIIFFFNDLFRCKKISKKIIVNEKFS